MTTFDDLFAFIDTLGDEYRLLTARSSAPNEAAIATTEAQLGFALPPDYRDFVARYGALYL
jgi:SMI1 / KNR4 family (SUKH-1)